MCTWGFCVHIRVCVCVCVRACVLEGASNNLHAASCENCVREEKWLTMLILPRVYMNRQHRQCTQTEIKLHIRLHFPQTWAQRAAKQMMYDNTENIMAAYTCWRFRTRPGLFRRLPEDLYNPSPYKSPHCCSTPDLVSNSIKRIDHFRFL